MPFPSSHLLLTLRWVNINYSQEMGQSSVRFASPHATSQARVDQCAAAVQSFWTLAGNIGNDYALQFIRLARIGADGHYSNSSSYDHLYNGVGFGLAGGASSSAYPLQIACASTLLTAVPHGQASKGRMFLPPIPAALPGGLLWSDATVNVRSNALRDMLGAVGPILGGPASVFSKGTIRGTQGLARAVTGIKTGKRPDVQRRRAKQVIETYGATSTLSAVPTDPGPVEDGAIGPF